MTYIHYWDYKYLSKILKNRNNGEKKIKRVFQKDDKGKKK